MAWLNGDGNGVGELLVSRDQVRTWKCECTSIVFRGNQLVAADYTAGKVPRLLSYPDDGSVPVPVAISGLPPASRFPLNSLSVDAAVSPADVIVGYGNSISASGGPQLLYRVDEEGRAVPFAPAASQVTSNGVPGDFVFSPDGTRAGFLLPGLGGYCADAETVVLANVATGAENQPAMPPAWYGPTRVGSGHPALRSLRWRPRPQVALADLMAPWPASSFRPRTTAWRQVPGSGLAAG